MDVDIHTTVSENKKREMEKVENAIREEQG